MTLPSRYRSSVEMAAEHGHAPALRLLAEHKASKARRTVRAAPRVTAEKATKAQRQENWQMVKEAVARRTGGRCELCEAPGSDPHHLLSGPLRRKYETPATVACLCRFCHDAIHAGNVLALEDAAALSPSPAAEPLGPAAIPNDRGES